MQKTLLVTGFLVLLVAICFFSIFKKQIVSGYTEVHFLVDRPYREVMLALATQDSLENVASSNGGRIINKNWNKLNVNLLGFRNQRLIQPVWIAEGDAWFAMQLNDPHLGNLDLTFAQQVYANPNGIIVSTYLLKPSKGLIEHSTFVGLEKWGETQTKCSVKCRLTVERRHPDNWQDYVQGIVSESSQRNANNTAKCIQEMAERRGIFIPIK